MTSSGNVPYNDIVTPARNNILSISNCTFKSEWQNFPEFQLWLRPIPDDKSKAWCQACEKVFKADLKSLRVHGVGRSHGRMVQAKFPELSASSSPPPAAVYNVITDRKGTYGLGILSKSENNTAAGSTLYVNPTNPSTNVLTCDPKQDKDSYVIVSMPKSELEEQENIEELQQLQFKQPIPKKINNEYKMRGSNKRTVSKTSSSTQQQFQDDLIETEDDVEEEEDDDDDDDDSESDFESKVEKARSSADRGRGTQKRNAFGYPVNSSQMLDVALVAQPAPFWKSKAIVNGHVSELKLSDYLGRYVVLFFYAQDFSKVCAKEINDLSSRVSDFRNINTEVVACSVDSYLTHQIWSKMSTKEGGVSYPKIPLLSDYTHDISKSYGCYLPEAGHSLRAHYIIDTNGILRHTTINDVHMTRDVSEILKLVQALQKIDEDNKNISENEEA